MRLGSADYIKLVLFNRRAKDILGETIFLCKVFPLVKDI